MKKKFGRPPLDRKKDKLVSFRMPSENYNKLKELDPKVSNTLRYIVEVYLLELANSEERFTEWNRKA
jgi:predicted DNA-binding protein